MIIKTIVENKTEKKDQQEAAENRKQFNKGKNKSRAHQLGRATPGHFKAFKPQNKDRFYFSIDNDNHQSLLVSYPQNRCRPAG